LDNFLFSGIFLVALCLNKMVEKFVLIATTGKNAKTAQNSLFQSTNFPICCLTIN